MNKLHLALLAGGKSAEREVSLKGAIEVENAIDLDKYRVTRYDPATDMGQLVKDAPTIDVAFILLHGRYGEDGTVQGFLELLGIPYQGSGVLGSSMAIDKNVAKIMYKQQGLPVAAWEMAEPSDVDNPERLLQTLDLPLVIKPVREGSSLGMSIATDRVTLSSGLATAFQHDSIVMVEQYIKGREVTGAVVGNDKLTALPLVEVIPGEEFAFFDYEAKYKAGATQEICPAPLAPELTARIQEYALTAHRVLQLRGYSRTDMMLTDKGDIYLLETNTIPGMTPTSLLPQAAAASGLDFSALIDLLLDLALEATQK